MIKNYVFYKLNAWDGLQGHYVSQTFMETSPVFQKLPWSVATWEKTLSTYIIYHTFSRFVNC
jgi:hypothetical protein